MCISIILYLNISWFLLHFNLDFNQNWWKYKWILKAKSIWNLNTNNFWLLYVVFQYGVTFRCEIALIFYIAKFFTFLLTLKCDDFQLHKLPLFYHLISHSFLCQNFAKTSKSKAKQHQNKADGTSQNQFIFHLLAVKMWFLFELASRPLFTINLRLCLLS